MAYSIQKSFSHQCSSQNLIVRSADRILSADSPANFTVDLSLDNGFQGSSLQLKEVWLPNTIYNIRTGINDLFVFSSQSSGSSTVTITAGAYTVATLIVALQALVNAVQANTLTISQNTTTGKLLFTANNGGNLIKLLASQWNKSTVALGFGLSGTDTAVFSSSLSSPFVPQLQPDILYLFVRELTPSSYTTSKRSQDRPTFLIPVNANTGDIITYKRNGDFDQHIQFESKRVFLNRLSVVLQYPGGEVVDLNGADWHFTLCTY